MWRCCVALLLLVHTAYAVQQSGRHFAPLVSGGGLPAACTATAAAVGRINAAAARCSQFAGILSLGAELSVGEVDEVHARFCGSSGCKEALEALSAVEVSCLPAPMAQIREQAPLLCQVEAGMHCPASLRRLLHTRCEFRAPAACAAAALCHWNDVSATCQQSSASANVLEQVCTPCVGALLSSNGSAHPATALLLQQYNQLCLTVNGQWCYARAREFVSATSVDLQLMSPQRLRGVCSDATTLLCARRLVQMSTAAAQRVAEQDFFVCTTESCRGDARCIAASCQPFFEDFARRQRIMDVAMSNLCTANQQNRMCVARQLSPEELQCVQEAVSGACGAGCDTLLTQLLQDEGCCVGLAHRLLVGDPVETLRLPGLTVVNYTATIGSSNSTSVAAPALQSHEMALGTPMPGGYMSFGVCPSSADSIARLASVQCAPPRDPVSLASIVRVNYRFATLSGSPLRLARVEDALARDVAATAGLTPLEIGNTTLVRDPGSGDTLFSFAIVAEEPEVISAAVSQLSRAFNNESVLMLTTRTVLASDCPDCVSWDGGASLLSSATLPPTPAPPPVATPSPPFIPPPQAPPSDGGAAPEEEEDGGNVNLGFLAFLVLIPILGGGAVLAAKMEDANE